MAYQRAVEKIFVCGSPRRQQVRLALPHEILHHYQHVLRSFPGRENLALEEGHATGYELQLARKLRGVHPYTDWFGRVQPLLLLGAATIFLHQQKGFEPPAELKEFLQRRGSGLLSVLYSQPYHSIGYDAFHVAESRHGSGIYRDALYKGFPF